MIRLKRGEVDLNRRRVYWELFEKKKVIERSKLVAEYEAGIRFACFMLAGELREDSCKLSWAKNKAELFEAKPLGHAEDIAQKIFDEEAPKSLQKFMDEGRKGRRVVREDSHGPYKKTVWFC